MSRFTLPKLHTLILVKFAKLELYVMQFQFRHEIRKVIGYRLEQG